MPLTESRSMKRVSDSSDSGDSDIEITGVQLAPRLAQQLKNAGLGVGLKCGKAVARSHSAATTDASQSQLCSSSTSLASIESNGSSSSSAYASGSEQSSSSLAVPLTLPVCRPSAASAISSAPSLREQSNSPCAAQLQQHNLLVYSSPAPAPAVAPQQQFISQCHQQQQQQNHSHLHPHAHPVSPLVTCSAAVPSFYIGAKADCIYATPASAAASASASASALASASATAIGASDEDMAISMSMSMRLGAECAMEAEESLAIGTQQQYCSPLSLYSTWLSHASFTTPGKLVELSATATDAAACAQQQSAQQSHCWDAAPQLHLTPIECWLQQQFAAALCNNSGM